MTVEQWADEQLTLAEGYLTGRAGAERRRVKLRWWSVPNSHRRTGAGTVTVLWSMARGNRFSDHDLHVALYEPDAAPGAPALVTFVAQEGSGLIEAAGRSLGTAVGRAEPGGALLVVTSRGTVMPASMPAAPEEATPGWSETDQPTGPAPGTESEPEAAQPEAQDPEGRVSPWRRGRRSRRAGRTPPPAGDGGGR